MENLDKPRTFHGNITADDLGRSLVGEFNRGNLRAQRLGSVKHVVVQIHTRQQAKSGGQTALSVAIRQVEDGVSIQLGKQSWLGIAASLGQTALWAWRSPWNLIHRLDDIAQDIEYLQLSERVWEFIEDTAYSAGASFELSERLKRLACAYCLTANPVGQPSCLACGAPLGTVQPGTCDNCGFVIIVGEMACPNCGKILLGST